MEPTGLFKSSMRFFSDQELCYADILTPQEVVARIQIAVLNFLRILTSSTPAISNLPLIDRRSSNSRVNQGILTDDLWIFLSHSFCTRSLMRSNAAKAFVRVWKLMEMCSQILIQDKRVTQRELFYKLLCDSPAYFPTQLHVNRTIQDVVALLQCSRCSLGIMASSRGLVAGRLLLQEPEQEVVDCTACGSSGYAISGDLDLLQKLTLKTDARYIIVIEKHAIFQRLAEDRIFNHIPSILITAKGYPDLATRFFLHRISKTFPHLPIFGLVDWNPAGLAILCTFKYGSIGMGLEAYRYACNVKWLGVRGDDLQLIPQESLVPLKPRDLQIAKSLMSSKILQEKYRQELTLMVEIGQKAELEALYHNGFDYLEKYIVKKIIQFSYI
ncbi:meiotic recombination protein SPO11-2 isoform X1 [Benincasa hispida]|uniref:meiotic recombination protein SPO11-2 isoform X1 n=2 Tax=Benincasa hispida TaxID=102211 RepID=UPI001902264F|nr:meiotic recombination protein SPO11-2 isoform X1 [Benincasa hispida]XP_038906473.1 meiotic recombination protein SPO11-2 isoform X1 [Benincasa hispida]XP_038906474.1 meiotic recombination protein SPO11-2 isoform X1 [Benincasa hispida]XP_038906475.1 meiotic recombination protein SPO11-2 isoform X1 [Benincasa hispida]XP_038906476.1 meiotic recombination protein SPO11-2 isoform X1 [Benincasa hispida]